MSFTTPSERWTSSTRRFVTLERMDGLRLARAIWIIALAVYGLESVLTAIAISTDTRAFGAESASLSVMALMAPLLVQIVAPLL